MVDGCHGKEYRLVAETASTGRWLSLACALLAGLVYLVLYTIFQENRIVSQ